MDTHSNHRTSLLTNFNDNDIKQIYSRIDGIGLLLAQRLPEITEIGNAELIKDFTTAIYGLSVIHGVISRKTNLNWSPEDSVEFLMSGTTAAERLLAELDNE